MFRILRAIKGHLAALARTFDPDTLTVTQAAEAISLLAAIEKAAAGLRLLLARRVDNESLWGESGERSAADWLARQTGQSTGDAARDLECSRRLQQLSEASDAVRNGELSPDQAKAVADGAAADPAAERSPVSPHSDSLSTLRDRSSRRPAAAFSMAASSEMASAAWATVSVSGSKVRARAARWPLTDRRIRNMCSIIPIGVGKVKPFQWIFYDLNTGIGHSWVRRPLRAQGCPSVPSDRRPAGNHQGPTGPPARCWHHAAAPLSPHLSLIHI